MPTNPGVILRVEAAIVMVLSVFLYRHIGGSWPRFALLFLVPDLSLAGYAWTVRFGTVLYNTVHTYALIWTAHIGVDRLLGFGLKYPTRFQDTHLQRI